MFFDMTTSLAIIGCNFPGWESLGASRNLNVTYLKPPVEGDDCIIEAEVVQIGKRLAMTRGVMKRAKDGVLLAICEHQKYMANKPHYTATKHIADEKTSKL
jgi:acyl-coenzyme A thioesterase 13